MKEDSNAKEDSDRLVQDARVSSRQWGAKGSKLSPQKSRLSLVSRPIRPIKGALPPLPPPEVLLRPARAFSNSDDPSRMLPRRLWCEATASHDISRTLLAHESGADRKPDMPTDGTEEPERQPENMRDACRRSDTEQPLRRLPGARPGRPS